MNLKRDPKKHSLYIWYLEDNQSDVTLLEKSIKPLLIERIQRALEETYVKAASQDRETAPKVELSIIQIPSVEDFESVVRQVEVRAADAKPEPSLILLDRLVPRKAGQDTTDLMDQAVGNPGEPFIAWLKRRFPGVPIAMLTNLGSISKTTTDHADIEYISKDDLNDKAQMAGRLLAILTKHQPAFWLNLQEYANKFVFSWHTPGHNQGAAFSSSTILRPFHTAFTQKETPLVFSADLSVSVDSLGDLSDPVNSQTPMSRAMLRAADVFGSARTYFCTNGTSSSNKTLLMTLLKPGDAVLVDRNCHKSVHQAIVMSGAIPIYMTPRFNTDLGLWRPLSLTEISKVLDKAIQGGLKPRLLVLTTCTYDGILFPVYELAQMVHSRGVLLQADEAWFPYGRFHPYYGGGAGDSQGRYNALDSDADFCVHSSHKALAAFSQASMLHIGKHFKKVLEEHDGTFDWVRERFGSFDQFEHRLVENLSYWLSTSPHYPMIASLDAATAQMSMEGCQLIGSLLRRAQELREWADKQGCEVKRENLIDPADPGYAKYGFDPLKFTVRVKERRKREVCEGLEKDGHRWEKTSSRTVLFLLTTGTYEGHVQHLLNVLEKNKALLGSGNEAPLQEPDISGQVAIPPVDAHYATGLYMTLTDIKRQLEQSTEGPSQNGLIACHMVTPYPPGVPTLLPGSHITKSVIEWIERILREGGEVHGLFNHEGEFSIRVLPCSEEYQKLLAKYGNDGTGDTLAKFAALNKLVD